MLRPVLDPVLGREILSRYTAFASSVGAPAPMEHLAPTGAAQPARYETYVENLYQVTQAIRKNYLINLQMDLRFLALQLASAMEQAGTAESRRIRMLERQVTVLREENGRLKAATRPAANPATPPQGTRAPMTLLADASRIVRQARLMAGTPLPSPETSRQERAATIPANKTAPSPAAPDRVLLSDQRRRPVPGTTVPEKEQPRASSLEKEKNEEKADGQILIPPAQTFRPAEPVAVPAQRILPRTESPQQAAPPVPAVTPKPAPAASHLSAAEPPKAPAATPRPTPATTLHPAPAGNARPAEQAKEKNSAQPLSEQAAARTQPRTDPARPSATRLPLGHTETAEENDWEAPLPDPRPARLQRPEPARRILRAEAAERVSTRQESAAPGQLSRSPRQESQLSRQTGLEPQEHAPATAREQHRPTKPPLTQSTPVSPAQAPAVPGQTTAATASPVQMPLSAAPLVHAAPPLTASSQAGLPVDSPAVKGAEQNPIFQPSGPISPVQMSPEPQTIPPAEAAVLVHNLPATPGTTTPATTPSPAVQAERTPAVATTGTIPAAARVYPEKPGVSASWEGNPAREHKAPGSVTLPPVSSVPRVLPRQPEQPGMAVPGQSRTAAAAPNSAQERMEIPGKKNPQEQPSPAGSPTLPAAAAAPLVHRASPAPDTAAPGTTPSPGQQTAVLHSQATSQTPSPAQGRTSAGPVPRTLAGQVTVPSPAIRRTADSVRPSESSDPQNNRTPAAETVFRAAAAQPLGQEPRRAPLPFTRVQLVPSAMSALDLTPERTPAPDQPGGKPMKMAAAPLLSVQPPLVPAAAGNTFPVAGGTPAVMKPFSAAPMTGKAPAPGPGAAALSQAGRPAGAAAGQTPPAGSPAPMELRRTPAVAGGQTPSGGMGQEPAGITTVHRTRTVRRETREDPPTTATVRLPGETISRPALPTLGPAEVERIADKVYRQIEERLRSEKMRRGM